VYNHPLPGKYEDFAFPTPTSGWLVSAVGEILHTSDGGATWTVQAKDKGRLRSVHFLDETRGFAGTITGTFWGTTDGGVTWTDITGMLPRKAQGFCGITNVGEVVHVVGKYTGRAADYFVSRDGGKTWTARDLLDLAQGLVDVMFLSESVGLIGGMAKSATINNGPAIILRTIDGGRNWRPVFTHDGGRGFAWKFFPISSTLVYAALQSQDGIYRTAKSRDAGETWEVQTVATGRRLGPGVQGIGFIDENTGWVGGFFQGLWGTTDGGRTWGEVPIPDATVNRFEKAGSTLFTAGSRGILRYDPAR
jgi:photosystem II stability/assembly factor-like uncharacterized protein